MSFTVPPVSMDVEYVIRGGLRIEVERDPAREEWWRARVVRDARRGNVVPAPWSPGKTFGSAISAATDAWALPWERRRRRREPARPARRFF